ncbi:serine threonine kinase [Trichoderma arundinaceum]|uniref:non-specific serine/threonine protein kinase n=1 Tax=Trichoderma arundinaceum TaxID=490622 RepID=A0A395NTG7_TRIAR|nr:serine threonine kinase [Trichoderma arundinaceum]
MAAPTHSHGASQEPSLAQLLDGMLQVCKRLSIWAKDHAGSDEPLTNLACKEIHSLCSLIFLFNSQVAELGPDCKDNAQDDRPALSERILQTLTHCKKQLFVTLDLLELHGQAERHGQEGALNALYARKYIIDDAVYGGSQHHYGREESLIHLGLELKGFIAEFAQDPIGGPMTAGNAVQRFQHLEPRLTDFLSRATKHFSPRYVHNYKSLADTPYVVDAAGDVFSGSYGAVQKVNHKRSGESLAMKTFHGVYTNKQVKKILREVGILEVCNHKNIVRFVQAFRTDDNDQSIRVVMAPWAPYTLLGFLHSPDVKRKARCPWFQPNSPQSNRYIYRMMYELADAVEYLHNHEIKHKDLKPENILIHREASDRPTALITDVGVSKIYKPGASTNFKDSTYEYLAPEQHAMKESTFKSDVWQLGCCFGAILAVAERGQSGYEELQDSFIRDDADCQCSIALEYPSFKEALDAICMSSNSNTAQRKVYAIVLGMLELDPHQRPSIGLVKAALLKLPGVKN